MMQGKGNVCVSGRVYVCRSVGVYAGQTLSSYSSCPPATARATGIVAAVACALAAADPLTLRHSLSRAQAPQHYR